MSESKRTITVQVHEADEVPSGLTYAYMSTDTGWELVSWYNDAARWHTVGTIWPIVNPGPWVELKDISQAVEKSDE